MSLMRFRGDHIAEITSFTPDQVAAFDMPTEFSSSDPDAGPPEA